MRRYTMGTDYTNERINGIYEGHSIRDKPNEQRYHESSIRDRHIYEGGPNLGF